MGVLTHPRQEVAVFQVAFVAPTKVAEPLFNFVVRGQGPPEVRATVLEVDVEVLEGVAGVTLQAGLACELFCEPVFAAQKCL